MRARLLLLTAAVLTTQTGCRLFERWQKDRPSAEPTARDRGKDPDWLRDRNRKGDSPYELPDRKKQPDSLLDPPTVPSSTVRTPPAGTWAGPTSKNFDLRNAAQRLISGVVETADGQVVEGAFVSLENADPTKNTPGAQVGVQTDRSGLFLIQGLKPGDTYVLTASVRNQAGRQYVTVPNQQVRIQLRDDFGVSPLTTPAPAGDRPAATASPSIPPPGDVAPPSLFDTPKGSTDTLPYPTNSDGSFSPVPAAPPVRPELVAPGPPAHNRLPPVAIPGPGGIAPPLLPTVPPSSPGTTSRSADRQYEIKLLDENGKVRTFPTGKDGDLVLLDFAATNCVHCSKAIPALTKLHDAYRDQAVRVVTVLCDPGTTRERLEAAEQYRKRHRFPYELLVEATAGQVQDAFGVKAYPHLVLLDGTGRKLWTGHPKQIDQLERTIRDFVDGRAK